MNTHSVFETEREKYERMWEVDDYRKVSPGDELVDHFIEVAAPRPGSFIVDVGCGTGRASLKLHKLRYHVTMLDAVPESLDPEVRKAMNLGMWFEQGCVWHDWPSRIVGFDYSFCCDVLEHIPVEYTMLVVNRCLQASQGAFFHISFDRDYFGQFIGNTLHLTVQPFQWWRDRLADAGELVDARDLLGHGTFYVKARG